MMQDYLTNISIKSKSARPLEVRSADIRLAALSDDRFDPLTLLSNCLYVQRCSKVDDITDMLSAALPPSQAASVLSRKHRRRTPESLLEFAHPQISGYKYQI